MATAKIVPQLWYSENAEEAAKFYVSILPDSKIDSVTTLPTDTPSGPAGTVKIVSFTLMGQQFGAMSAPPLGAFNYAISFMVMCEDQKEIDKYWDALQQGGGEPQSCGWLKDRYGLMWQITPRALIELMKDPDRAKAKRVADAMLPMDKIDLAAILKAAENR